MYERKSDTVSLYSTSPDDYSYYSFGGRMADDDGMEFAPAAGGVAGPAAPEAQRRPGSASDDGSSESQAPTAAVRQNFAEVWLWSDLSIPTGYPNSDECPPSVTSRT